MSKKKRIKLNCEQCGEVITGRGKRFCSVTCHGLWNSENRRGENGANWRGGDVKLVCEQCEKEFDVIQARADKARFCSPRCRGRWHSENFGGENSHLWKGGKVTLICGHCGEEFEAWPFRKGEAIFCSIECYGLWQSENRCGENNPSWKEKVKLNCEQCGEEFGVVPSWADQRFCSRKCKYLWMSERFSRENSPLWKGGISFEPYGPDWTDKLKERVRKRDNYTCAISGDVWYLGQDKFPVHHCDYDKTNNDPNNLITLSPGSHARTNGNRRHWQALLIPIAEMRAIGERA